MLKRFVFGRRQSTLTFNVLSLDGTILTFDLESRSTGADVLDRVMEANGIQGEREYFGLLSPTVEPQPHWLVLTKPLKKQLPGRQPYTVNLRVCMYPRDHQTITQPTTRHLLYLQVKQDMYSGRLSCQNSELLYKIAGLALQSEIGDFSAQRCGLTYVSDFELIPVLTHSTEESIAHVHRLNRGRTSSDCDHELLDIAQDLATYGTISYSVQDSSRQNVTIFVSPSGVRVQQRTTERASFEWDSIERITTRGKGVTFHISATHTLAPYQVQYTCPNSSQAHNIASHCQYLLESYCVPVAEAERPKSRLRRWFSSRRSFRRQPSPMRRHLKENGHNRRVLNGRRASFGGDLTSGPSLNTVTASSRMSLRASSRSDSKLVIYGAGGLASPSKESVQMSPNHHTLELEANDVKMHQADVLATTPPSRGSGASPPPRTMGTTPPLRGSVADVEHKSVSSLLKGHTPHTSSPLHHRHTSNNRKSSSNYTSQSNAGEGERRSYVQEVGSPVKSLVFIDREEQGRHGNRLGSLRQSSSASQGALPQSSYDYNQPPPKVEWYHSDILKSPGREGEREKGQPWYMDEARSPGHSQPERVRDSYHELGRGRTDSVQSQPAYDQASSSGYSYQRHNSVEHNYRHSGSVEAFQHQASAHTGAASSGRRFHHSRSIDHIESRDSRDVRHSSAAKARARHHHHHHHRHHHHHSGGHSRSTRSSSDLTERRNVKSSSLTRDTPPRLQEEDEPEGQSSLRYVGGNHPAKPQNRGQYRLSLPESSYYDNGNRAMSHHSNARRSRKALSNTGLTSTGSLSQPADLGLGLSSKLGSIASLEYQASLAELSQTDVSSVIDPHTRSFIFEGSQTNSQGTIL